MSLGGTQVQTSQSKPWGPQGDLFRMAINKGEKLYKDAPDPFSMVVPMSGQTKAGYDSLRGVANRNADGRGLSENLQGIINNGGFNGRQVQALKNFQQTANSKYDFNANPGSQDVLRGILRDTKSAVNLDAAASGRYASGLHQGRLAQDVADTSSQFRMQDYNNWLNRKDSANSSLFNAAQAGQGNMLSAYQGLQAPAQTRLGVGQGYEDLRRRELDDKARIQNVPWENLQKLLAVGSGTGNYGNTTSTAPGPSPFLQGLGIAGTAGNFLFGTNPMASGGLMGLFQ